MYVACVINTGNTSKSKQTGLKETLSLSYLGATPELAAQQALQTRNVSYPETSYPYMQVLVGELNLVAQAPRPLVDLIPVKAEAS